MMVSDFKSENGRILDNCIEIFTLRGRFLEQANNGDCVYVRGKLEQVSDRKVSEMRQRIVIGTDPDDFMGPI